MNKEVRHLKEDKNIATSGQSGSLAKSGRFLLLKNSRGLALVETIVALLILSSVLVSLLTMVQFARARAVANYHDRYVLLRLDAEMQLIKHYQRSFNVMPTLIPKTFNIPQSGGYRHKPIVVTINFLDTVEWDSLVGPDIGFHKIVATAEWNENMPKLGGRKNAVEKRFITLREDYYFQRGA